ncbi:MAG: hypothetical protein EZS28_031353 [Streblomastix strix]|uniref:Uncharacterized protein n=1 Tax=Streblomastix strix TaxID=222440 RepID=A0A5J4UT44_9EUKA|nr:MAG: hypothetical protein EZS28_031353 [Streblomastix strix]
MSALQSLIIVITSISSITPPSQRGIYYSSILHLIERPRGIRSSTQRLNALSCLNKSDNTTAMIKQNRFQSLELITQLLGLVVPTLEEKQHTLLVQSLTLSRVLVVSFSELLQIASKAMQKGSNTDQQEGNGLENIDEFEKCFKSAQIARNDGCPHHKLLLLRLSQLLSSTGGNDTVIQDLCSAVKNALEIACFQRQRFNF